MAKKSRKTSFSHAVIDVDAGTITEITADNEHEYQIDEVLREWDGVENIRFSISMDEDF